MAAVSSAAVDRPQTRVITYKKVWNERPRPGLERADRHLPL